MALQNSKLVMNIDSNINKQHLFSLSEKFLNYLKKQRIFVQIINDRIEDKKLFSSFIFYVLKKKFFNMKQFSERLFYLNILISEV